MWTRRAAKRLGSPPCSLTRSAAVCCLRRCPSSLRTHRRVDITSGLERRARERLATIAAATDPSTGIRIGFGDPAHALSELARHFDHGKRIADFDLPDLVACNPGLAGDSAHEISRPHVILFPEPDEQAHERAWRASG